MSSSPASAQSLTIRAMLAVALMVGFYALALAIAAGLLFILYTMVVYGHRVNIRIALFALIGAATVLWSIIPRPDRFIPPGPLLSPTQQPKLFKTIQDVAAATGQAMPVEVYLVCDTNAWVANRGGLMGVGSRRVMGVGLPLLQTLTVSQLRAVLAHEFGHYHAGDTRLGPWVYKTRAAIGRTIMNLSQQSSLLQRPFVWYGNMFLRITHAVSRRQEFAADALASQVAGSRALVEGLERIYGSAVAFEAYWRSAVTPVLHAGFRPPLTAGFDRYISASLVKKFMAEVTEKKLAEGETNAYDTHPPLRSRIQAVADLPQGQQLADDPPAISLLENVPHLESQLFSKLAQLNRLSGLKPVTWEETGVKVYLPIWKRFAHNHTSRLTGITPASFPEIARNLNEFANKFPAAPAQDRRSQASSALGVALAVALYEQGWELHTPLHDQAYFQHDEVAMYPFSVIEDLADGKLRAEDWQQQCESTGIATLDLSKIVMESPAS